MKNMKKIIAVLLVLAALASLFTACSTKPAESSTTQRAFCRGNRPGKGDSGTCDIEDVSAGG